VGTPVGDKNQITFLQRHVPTISGPILEIGSKDYGSTSSFRTVYPSNEYIGLDMVPGAGVDKIIDLAEGIGDLQENYFSLIVCCSVLEHVSKPWKMAENITRLIASGGTLYMSVPWVWRYHAYPDDYFRFSVRGIEALFPAFTWKHPTYSTNIDGEFVSLANLTVDNSLAKFVKINDQEQRKYLPYLMVNMIGEKH
jgi:SAM-dependent methyltransferase